MTWLHTNAPADRDGSAATPAARIAATARLAGRVANRAAGPSARTGRCHHIAWSRLAAFSPGVDQATPCRRITGSRIV